MVQSVVLSLSRLSPGFAAVRPMGVASRPQGRLGNRTIVIHGDFSDVHSFVAYWKSSAKEQPGTVAEAFLCRLQLVLYKLPYQNLPALECFPPRERRVPVRVSTMLMDDAHYQMSPWPSQRLPWRPPPSLGEILPSPPVDRHAVREFKGQGDWGETSPARKSQSDAFFSQREADCIPTCAYCSKSCSGITPEKCNPGHSGYARDSPL